MQWWSSSVGKHTLTPVVDSGGGLLNETGSGIGNGLVDGFVFIHSWSDCRLLNHTGAVTVTMTDLGGLRRHVTGGVVPPDGLFLPPCLLAAVVCED